MQRKHWTEAVKAENERLRAEINRLRLQPSLVSLAHEIGNNIMTILANTPFEKWPDLAKTAFKYAAKRQETTAYFYKERLPD